jgi:hypothetical protein
MDTSLAGGVGSLSTSPPETEKPPQLKKAGQPGWKKPVIAAFASTCVVLGIVANVAQLGVLPTRTARALLWAVGFTFLLYLVIQFWQLYFVERIRQLRADLDARDDTLVQLRSAIERINDREKQWSSETLELTIIIGTDDDTDLVVEKRVTTPKPLVTSRTMRPIVPTGRQQIVSLDAISLTVHREDGEITLLPLSESTDKLKVFLVFEPAVTTNTEWQVKYQPRGLWQPLRERGFDVLGWDDRLHNTDDGTPSAFTEFTAVFSFPPGNQPSVKERRGHGKLTAPVERSDKRWEVRWCDEDPAGRRYDWDITQPLRGAQR